MDPFNIQKTPVPSGESAEGQKRFTKNSSPLSETKESEIISLIRHAVNAKHT